jgi:4-amino-4-deoxy-L-arabinose transferase-like glycosyltransferase
VIALGIRLLFAWDYASHRPRQALSVIPFLFESGNIAHSVATGKGFASPFRIDTGPTAWTTPLYPLLLGGLMRLFGPYTYASYAAAVAVNILFSSLVCVPLYFAGKRIGGASLGALAAWLWAIFPNAILLTYESLWETCVSAWLGAALLWATLRVSESARARAWCAYGLLFGLTLMTNAALLSLLPLLAGWALYRSSRRGQRWLRNAALTAGLAAAGCLPWTIRNYTVFHTLIPLRSILGLQLWVGNNPEAKVNNTPFTTRPSVRSTSIWAKSLTCGKRRPMPLLTWQATLAGKWRSWPAGSFRCGAAAPPRPSTIS